MAPLTRELLIVELVDVVVVESDDEDGQSNEKYGEHGCKQITVENTAVIVLSRPFHVGESREDAQTQLKVAFKEKANQATPEEHFVILVVPLGCQLVIVFEAGQDCIDN